MPPPTSQPRKPDPNSAAKERNEYIPSFIAKKPFYVPDTDDAGESTEDDYLRHQRLQKEEDSSSLSKATWYERGAKLGPAATKYRKGACENCGSLSHKAKDCLYRKRKHGAKYSGKDIQADERVQDLGKVGWDAKRDRWNGYNPQEYQNVVEEYNELEGLKKQLNGGDGEEGDKYEEETDMGREQGKGTKNLRIREDTAKYLLNLDLDSAKYDPKTRSMLDAGELNDKAAALVAEEGFVKKSGDAAEFEAAQRYAWETQERGDKNKLHLQANPTAGEFMRKKAEKEAEDKRSSHRKALLDKYGAQDTFAADAAKVAAVTASERFVEYDEAGQIKGLLKPVPKSKYPEDVYINNHTAVWGSWWSDFQWGYACCHSLEKRSYCTGEAGIRAFEEEAKRRAGADLAAGGEEDAEGLSAEHQSEIVPRALAWREEERNEEHVPNGVDDDRKARMDAVEKRKRTLDQMKNGVTDEEMEEYRRKRVNAADPMAKMLGSDALAS